MGRKPTPAIQRKIEEAEMRIINGYSTIYASCEGKLYGTSDLPEWIADWANWVRQILCPEFTLYVKTKDTPIEGSRCIASCHAEEGYLSAELRFGRALEDNEEGHITVIHEVCHVLLSKMSGAMENICVAMAGINKATEPERDLGPSCTDVPKSVLNHPVIGPLFNIYTNAEEETVTRLSRILYHLAKTTTQEEGKPPCLF